MTKSTIPQIDFKEHAQAKWTAQETANVQIVTEFFQHLMNEHDFDYTLKTYGEVPYLQHNKAIPNNIDGLVGYVKNLTKRFPDYAFDVKKIFADGDIVVLHSHTTLKAKDRGNEKKGFIITDTFRLENDQMVEHWDAIQPIDLRTRLLWLMIGGTVGNDNSLF